MLKFERECTDYESALFIRVENEVARSVDARSLNARNIVLLISEHSRDLRWKEGWSAQAYITLERLYALKRKIAGICTDDGTVWHRLTCMNIVQHILYMMLSTAQQKYDMRRERRQKKLTFWRQRYVVYERARHQISFQYARDLVPICVKIPLCSNMRLCSNIR